MHNGTGPGTLVGAATAAMAEGVVLYISYGSEQDFVSTLRIVDGR